MPSWRSPAAGADQVLTLSALRRAIPPVDPRQDDQRDGIASLTGSPSGGHPATSWCGRRRRCRRQRSRSRRSPARRRRTCAPARSPCRPARRFGTWSFMIRTHDAPDFRSLTSRNDIGDVLLLVASGRMFVTMRTHARSYTASCSAWCAFVARAHSAAARLVCEGYAARGQRRRPADSCRDGRRPREP